MNHRGHLTVDEHGRLVCTCAMERLYAPLDDPDEPPQHVRYRSTVSCVRDVEPTESGSYYYRCIQCGASGWSGI